MAVLIGALVAVAAVSVATTALVSLFQKSKIPEEEIENAETVASEEASTEDQAPAVCAECESTYQIKSGDTLSEIAAAHGTSVNELMRANSQIKDPNLIQPGNKINLPTEHAEDSLLQTLATPDPMDQTEFGKDFEDITGSKLSHTIAQYKRDTGKDLNPETVEKLFTDADKAKEILMEDEDIHTTYRNILNQNIPATVEEAKAAGFTKKMKIASKFHDPDNNTKWVGPRGHLEAVYNRETGALDETKEYKGTFNFFTDDWKWIAADHWKADAEPWEKWDKAAWEAKNKSRE